MVELDSTVWRCERCGTREQVSMSAGNQMLCEGCKKVAEQAVGRSPDELAEILIITLEKGRNISYLYHLEKIISWCKDDKVVKRAVQCLAKHEEEEEI